MNKEAVLDNVIDYMERHNMNPQYANGIAEMGYDDKPIIMADWWQNRDGDMHTKLGDFVEEKLDIEAVFYDEWTTCSDCYKAVRTSPDSYGWEPSFIWGSDCEIICHECAEDSIDDIIEYYKNNTGSAVPSWCYPLMANEGFICYSPDEYCQRFETGFYPGQNDMPQDVAKDIEENLPDHDYIFKIDSVGQFDCHWSVFIRKNDE